MVFVYNLVDCLRFYRAVFVLGQQQQNKNISLQQAYLLTVISWFSVTLLAAIPFMLYGISGADAVFEAASGISTTGATVFADIEALPRSFLLWRAILNGLGGVGIVIFAIAMLPFLGIGGMQISNGKTRMSTRSLCPKSAISPNGLFSSMLS